MSFREKYGLPPKETRRCPICGLEATGGKPCKAHANAQNVLVHKARRLHRFLCEAIDEARA